MHGQSIENIDVAPRAKPHVLNILQMHGQSIENIDVAPRAKPHVLNILQ
jgi:hypothetical protein